MVEEEEGGAGEIYVMEIFIRMKIMIRDDTMCHDLKGHVPAHNLCTSGGHLLARRVIMGRSFTSLATKRVVKCRFYVAKVRKASSALNVRGMSEIGGTSLGGTN
jgi:hypothetical protein